MTITILGANRLHPNTQLVAVETSPVLPAEITERKYIENLWPQEEFDFCTIDDWVAWDSHGREHKLREATWYKHWKSTRQRKEFFKRKR